MRPLISIITPCFNSVDFIEQTIDSVLSENYNYLEYIIIDGGSTDGTLDVIKKYEKHITYWVSEPDKGQSEAINKGISKSSGEIFNWINSDDYLEQGALEKIAAHFEDPKCKVVCGKSRNFSEHSSKISSGTDIFESLEKTIGQARIDQPETWFRREAFVNTGLLSEKLHFLMDREWWIRYLLQYGLTGIVQTNDLLVHFRLHENSKTVAQSKQFQIDHDTIFAAISENFGQPSLSQLIRSNFPTLTPYQFPQIESRTVDIYTVLQYYLLKRSHECYYAGEHSKASILLREIAPSNFSIEDQKLYKKIKFRNTPILSGIRRIVK